MKNRGSISTLPPDEMEEIMGLPLNEKRRYFIAGYADFDISTLVLFRGDGSSEMIPFSFFVPNAVCGPNFQQFEIIDFGQAVKLGEYEASTRSILIDIDPEYKAYCESIKIMN